jgi:hypothetical protein
MRDQRDVLQIQRIEHRCEIVRQRVDVEPATRIARAAVAAAVIGDAARALGERRRLVAPAIGCEGPTAHENERLARAPVAVEELGAVARLDERTGDASG